MLLYFGAGIDSFLHLKTGSRSGDHCEQDASPIIALGYIFSPNDDILILMVCRLIFIRPASYVMSPAQSGRFWTSPF